MHLSLSLYIYIYLYMYVYYIYIYTYHMYYPLRRGQRLGFPTVTPAAVLPHTQSPVASTKESSFFEASKNEHTNLNLFFSM